MTETRSTCPYCGVGCGVIISTQDGQISGVRGDPQHPANFGRLCSKGASLHLSAGAEIQRQTRLLQPMRRLERSAAPQPLSWDAALDLAADQFAQVVQRDGPDAVGFYGSGQWLTEDYYVFNKLVKGLIGTNNLDTNSRLCMSSAVAAYKQSLGSDAPPACYEDIALADCIFIAGANPAFAHPILFRQLEDARRAKPQQKLIVCDPRRTDSAELADLFLPLQPGSDVMLFNGLLHIMLWEGWTQPDFIQRHTQGFEALRDLVRECTPELVAQTCGLPKQDLLTAARWFAQSGATLSLYCQGLNQSRHGTAKNSALINLHLATAQIAKPGAGPFSLTGQPNAMGGREVGGMANLLSAHRDMRKADDRAEVAALWGLERVPEQPGKTAVQMFEAAADGEIKALWIACTNPAQSMPDQTTVRRALQRAEFVVVQEAFATAASCAYADLLLPAATWGEKDGTVTNSERRISRVRAAVPSPRLNTHAPRADWQIAQDFGQRLARRLGRGEGLLNYANAEAVWNEHRESTRGRDLDITGLSYALLDAQGPQQWPYPAHATSGQARLYQDRRFATPDGLARFIATPYRPLAELRDARYPFSLSTGRLRDQWHGTTRTGNLGRLFSEAPEPCVQMHAQDMARLALRDGDLVHVTSRRGSLLLPAQASAAQSLGQVFIAMHWGAEVLGGQSSTGQPLAGVNALTTSVHCPQSFQPELKHAAVKVLKAELPWKLLGLAWLPAEQALRARERPRPLLARFPFASCVPFARPTALAQDDGTNRTGLQFRAAAHEPVPAELLAEIEAALDLAHSDTLRYSDRRLGQHRAARLTRQSDASLRLDALLLCGDTQAEAWIKPLLQQELPAQRYGQQLLRAGAKAPVDLPAPAKLICTCFNVSESAIRQQLDQLQHLSNDSERMAQLQGALRCGTQCGSCKPQLQRMLRAPAKLEQASGTIAA